MRHPSAAALCGLLALAAPAAVHALGASLVGSGYTQPLFLTAPAGDSRLFIVEKGGVIKVQQGGASSVFLDISGLVDAAGERGLLGLAFDPGYASNGRFYVNYIDRTTRHTVVAEFTAADPAAGSVDAGTRRTVITIEQPAGRSNHKAGWIGFSPTDPGALYIATGDGGSGNDPDNLALNLGSNLGKMLRITPTPGGGYTVPADNPFVGVAGNDEIWAFGLRNPYRNSFDRLSGDLWIADVGQGAREEVNFQAAGFGGGANYGWRLREGFIATPRIGGAKTADMVDPLFDYARSVGGSVIGGYVVRNSVEAALNGHYLFGDYINGRLFSFDPAQPGAGLNNLTAAFGTPFGAFQLSSFGEDGLGNLYAMGFNGNVYLLAAAVPEPPAAGLLAAGLALLGLLRRRRRG